MKMIIRSKYPTRPINQSTNLPINPTKGGEKKMTNFKRQLISVIAAGTMVLNLATPALATTIVISGNGSNSDSEVDVELENETEVVQTNVADIKNDIDVDSDTGNNDAEDNTGGDVSIDTGDATSTVTVSNNVNTNAASVDCCEAGGDVDVLVEGNGTHSDNNVWLDRKSEIDIEQLNFADVDNDVDVDSDTGGNDAEDNTGGSVEIKTGKADTTVTLSTKANSNMAMVGNASSNGGSLSARILGNGSNSDNEIDLELENNVWLDQINVLDLENDVDVDSDTGDNDAEDNTGGSVLIDTGDVDTDVTVDNMVNFNAADVDCGCLLDDIMAKISGNGTDSDNEIELEVEGETDVEQENYCGAEGPGIQSGNRGSDCETDVDVDSDTGNNDAEDNTGDPGDDPTVETGDVDNNVEVNNSGNVNAFGVDLDDLDWPDFSGFSFSFTFDLQDLLDLLNG